MKKIILFCSLWLSLTYNLYALDPKQISETIVSVENYVEKSKHQLEIALKLREMLVNLESLEESVQLNKTQKDTIELWVKTATTTCLFIEKNKLEHLFSEAYLDKLTFLKNIYLKNHPIPGNIS